MTSSDIIPPPDIYDKLIDNQYTRWFYNNLKKIFVYVGLFFFIIYMHRKGNRACDLDTILVRLNTTHVLLGGRVFRETGIPEHQEREGSVAEPEVPQIVQESASFQPIFPGAGQENHPYLIRRSGPNYTELMDVTPPKFLETYKNPCWLEKMNDPLIYNGNVFYENDNYKEYFWMMEKKLSDRVKAGKTWRVRCFPYFFVAGFPKCGTTDLYDKLLLHPDVASGAAKEPQYWSRFRVGWTQHGYIPISQYLDIFDNAAMELEEQVEETEERMYHSKILGDGSVNTIWENHWWNHLPEGAKHENGPNYLTSDYIHHINPEAKIIVILRNPTTRLYSDYLFFNAHNQKSVEDFHRQATQIITAFQDCFKTRPMRDCLVDFKLYTINDVHPKEGLYSIFLEEWLKLFPREQFYVTRLEDFAVDRLRVLNEIYQFLGVRALPDYIANTVNEMEKSAYKHVEAGEMLPETKQFIDDFYRPYNEKLVTLLHDHKYLW